MGTEFQGEGILCSNYAYHLVNILENRQKVVETPMKVCMIYLVNETLGGAIISVVNYLYTKMGSLCRTECRTELCVPLS